MSSSTILGNSFLLPFPTSFYVPKLKSPSHTYVSDRQKCIRSIAKQISDIRNEEIVIVGGGVGGLTTALALHRHGIRSVVLEKCSSYSTNWGTQLTVFKNGWKVLDLLGVGDQLRSQFLLLQGASVRTEEGNEIRTFDFKDFDTSQELRSVDKGALLRTLAGKLPEHSIQFSSQLANIYHDETTGENKLELSNGQVLSAKVVIGCDGVRSPIARWMGFPEPNYAGHCAFRGLAHYPNGWSSQPRVNYIYGRGIRAGFIPVSSTSVYWFICYNTTDLKATEPQEMKRRARELVKNWPNELLDAIDHTPEDKIVSSPHEDRWLWPILTPRVSKGTVVLLGDAWHPMTPNLGLGGCCALEDAAVLAKKLSTVTHSKDQSRTHSSHMVMKGGHVSSR